jgi:MATE family multidrug resistance protein
MMMQAFRATLKIAIPLILGNLTQVAYGLIDTAMIGRLGYRELAAASLVSNVVAIPLVIGMGLMIAITPLVAIANGKNDFQKSSHVLFNGWALSIIAGCILAACVHLLAMYVQHMGQEPAVAVLAKKYLIIMGYSILPMMMFLATKQFTDALQFTKTAMILSLISLPINAFLCWVFIYGNLGMPTLGINGAGLATLISRILLAIAMIVVVIKHPLFTKYIQLRKQAWQVKLSTLQEMLKLGIPSSLQYCMEAGAFSISGIMVGWLGAVQQASHQVALNCASTTFMASLGFSMAGSIRVSDAYGRCNVSAIAAIGKSTAIGGLLYGAFSGLLLIALCKYLPYIFTNDDAVVTTSTMLLFYAAVFQISDATQAIGVGLCRGIKDVVRPTIYVAIAYWLIGIPIGYVLAFIYKMGAAGIWIGLVVGLSVSSILLNHRFFKNINNKAV